jgi:PAS domain S-box-containing protein
MPAEFLNPAHYALNSYALAPFVAAVAIVVLGMVVLAREHYSRVSITFHIMTLSAGIWLFGYAVMYCALSESTAMVWAFVGLLGVTLIPASVYHFTVEALKKYPRHKHQVWLAWFIGGAFFIAAVLSDTFLSGVARFWWGYYPKYRWLSIGFLIFFFASMAASLSHYWRDVRHAKLDSAKKRSKALFIAFCVAYLGSFDYLAAFGIPLYPFGYAAVLGFVILTGRALWHYRLVDITPAFAATEIIQAMADALLVLDSEGIVRVVNRAACALFNRTAEDLLGSRIENLTKLLAPSEAGLDRLIMGGSLRDLETDLLIPRAGITTVSTSASAIRDESMQPIALVCIIRDVTATRQQAADLERASRVKDEFLSVMSHELRTPLNIIAGYTKIVQDGLLGDVNAEQVKALDKVSRHSNEMLVMVNSIMAATKIEAGVVNIECDEFALADFLADLKLLYDYSFGKNVTLAWDYPENLPVIRTDRDKLKHIIQNLVNNALKFTDEGVVTISARQPPGTDRVELSVADSGIGIADEELPSIFDRFRQVDSSRTRSHGGVGLGLHIVKTFAQLLGGTVEVVSRPGEGSTFTIALPRVYEGCGAARSVVIRRTNGAPKLLKR